MNFLSNIDNVRKKVYQGNNNNIKKQSIKLLPDRYSLINQLIESRIDAQKENEFYKENAKQLNDKVKKIKEYLNTLDKEQQREYAEEYIKNNNYIPIQYLNKKDRKTLEEIEKYNYLTAIKDNTRTKPVYNHDGSLISIEDKYKPFIKKKGTKDVVPYMNLSIADAIFGHTPVKYFIEDIATKQLQNIGKAIGLDNLGNSTYTEKSFTKTQLKELDKQVRAAIELSGINPLRIGNDTIHIPFNANDIYPLLYGRKYSSDLLSTWNKQFGTLPAADLEVILGNINNLKVYKEGYEFDDLYDFDPNRGKFKNKSNYATLRGLGSKYGHVNDDKENSKIKFKVKRKVNDW